MRTPGVGVIPAADGQTEHVFFTAETLWLTWLDGRSQIH